MTLTDFHKQAYTAGAQQALTEVGLVKNAILLGTHPPGLSEEDVDESRMALARIDRPDAPHPDDFVPAHMALRGTFGGLAGGALGGLFGLRQSALSNPGADLDWGQAGRSALLGTLLGGGAGLVSGYRSGDQQRDDYETYAARRALEGKESARAALIEELKARHPLPSRQRDIATRALGTGLIVSALAGTRAAAAQKREGRMSLDWGELLPWVAGGGALGALVGGGLEASPFGTSDRKNRSNLLKELRAKQPDLFEQMAQSRAGLDHYGRIYE